MIYRGLDHRPGRGVSANPGKEARVDSETTRGGMRPVHAIVAATVAIALASAGCGGDDGSGASAASRPAATPTQESTPETPTKAAYIKQVNAFCSGKGNAKARKAGGAIDSAIARAGTDLNAAIESGSDAEAILDRVGLLHVRLADNLDAAMRRIKAMPAPADGGATGFLSAFARTTELTREFATSVQKMDGPSSEWLPRLNRSATAISRAAARESKAARAYGIKECSRV